MPNALNELLKVLRADRLPTDHPIKGVSAALTRLGYTEKVTGSHYVWRQKEHPRIVISVHDGKVPRAALEDLQALFTKLGLL